MESGLINRLRRREGGQALVFFAVVLPAMLGTMGLALYGGRIFLEYRHMQGAADMAAIVGAQDLGCTGAACAGRAKQDACVTAHSNGYGGGWSGGTCASGGTSTVTPSVPPVTCSPYSLNYGNNRTPSNSCNPGSYSPSEYDYIEVQITQNLGTIPIFNTPITEGVHAVARHGSPTPVDYAITVLDPSMSGALTFQGTGGGGQVFVIGSAISDSTSSSSIKAGGNRTDYTCGGQWYTASSSETSAPGNLSSVQQSSPNFAPPSCGGTADAATSWHSNQPQVPDPYANVSEPPSSMANCTPCGSAGQFYYWKTSRSTGTWNNNGSGSSAGNPAGIGNGDNVEFFPGVYTDIKITGGNVYFNPGVYTFTGTSGFAASGGDLCVFGAPICDRFSSTAIPGTSSDCSSASFSVVNPNTWYYYCSPWGTWDTWLVSSNPPPASSSCPNGTCLNIAPTFVTPSGGTAAPWGLNGVTFFFKDSNTNGGFQITGSGVESLAFPDPCPGTSTAPMTPNQVPFQTVMGTGDSGQTTAVYTYSQSGGSLPAVTAGSDLTSPNPGQSYPSADLTVIGEDTCRGAPASGGNPATGYGGMIPDVWSGEMSTVGSQNYVYSNGMLVHFLAFARNQHIAYDLEGAGVQLWWGILYNPANTSYSNGVESGGGCGNSCMVKLAGSSGGANGPPMMIGQIIADNVTITGTSTMELFYHPCNPTTQLCLQGAGSSLVQ